MGMLGDGRDLLLYAPVGIPDPVAWLELVKTQIMGVDAKGNARPVEDMLFFLQTCYRSQLDPLTRQIYAVYRWDSKLGREKMTVQVSIDGMRLTAQRSKYYGGQDDALFIPQDESDTHPTKATVTVYRLNPINGDRMPVTASARWAEYVPLGRDGKPMGLWQKMPYLMLAKVAEALALRKAFPAELSGLYSADEMEQASSGDGEVVESTARRLPAKSETVLATVAEAAAPSEESIVYDHTEAMTPVLHRTIHNQEDLDRVIDEMATEEQQAADGQKVQVQPKPQPTQPERPKETPKPTGNGATKTSNGNRAKAAKIDAKAHNDFKVLAEILAADEPHYAKDGQADIYHILLSANACGFDTITTENLDDVVNALKERAQSKKDGK